MNVDRGGEAALGSCGSSYAKTKPSNNLNCGPSTREGRNKAGKESNSQRDEHKNIRD